MSDVVARDMAKKTRRKLDSEVRRLRRLIVVGW